MYTYFGHNASVLIVSLRLRRAATAPKHASASDIGPGIPLDKLESVFEPFVQHHRRLLPGEGSGLGLAISRDLARGMGDDLEAVAGRAQGAMLVLRLPLTTAAPAEP